MLKFVENFSSIRKLGQLLFFGAADPESTAPSEMFCSGFTVSDAGVCFFVASCTWINFGRARNWGSGRGGS